MDGYISFSELNDFLYCPHSLYLHSLYKNYKTQIYHDTPQTDGKAAHETIDQNTYKRGGWQSGRWLCSPDYKIYGKCDLYNPHTGELVERKKTVRKVYGGQKMQVWAQAACLEEMGEIVSSIRIHSMTDNKSYEIANLDANVKRSLHDLISQIQTFRLADMSEMAIDCEKCKECIYSPLYPISKPISL